MRVLAINLILIFANITASAAQADNGLLQKRSSYSFEETVTKLKTALAERNIGVMSIIDHAAGASKVDMTLRPTTLLIFGNPAIGTQLITTSQSIALDLPLKAVIYEDDQGNICVEYNDIYYIAKRHGIASEHPVVGRIASSLDTVTDLATKPATPNDN